MLNGVDISSYQNRVDYNSYDFVLIKASEGNNWKDPGLDRHLTGLFGTTDPTPQDTKNYGFYHYARPELGNSPEQEAKSFLSFISGQVRHCVMALDWEGTALSYSPDWALKWLEYVYKQTGVKPLLYIQASQAKLSKYTPIANADFGLWVAHWGVEQPTYSNWKNWAIWQYQGSPLDLDYFNGGTAQWKKYCGLEEKDMDEATVRKIAKEEADNAIKNYFSKLENAPAADWAYMAISWCMANGVMNGDEEGNPNKFRPADLITRQEVAQTVYNYNRMITDKL